MRQASQPEAGKRVCPRLPSRGSWQSRGWDLLEILGLPNPMPPSSLPGELSGTQGLPYFRASFGPLGLALKPITNGPSPHRGSLKSLFLQHLRPQEGTLTGSPVAFLSTASSDQCLPLQPNPPPSAGKA